MSLILGERNDGNTGANEQNLHDAGARIYLPVQAGDQVGDRDVEQAGRRDRQGERQGLERLFQREVADARRRSRRSGWSGD